MVVEADFVVIDPHSRSLVFDDGFILPMAMLGIHPDNADPDVPDKEFIFNFLYEIKQIFDEPHAKYGAVFGNVAFIDCSYVFNTVLNSIETELDPTWFVATPGLYDQVLNAIKRIQNYLDTNDITMCNYAFEMDGCLKDQATYYIDSYDEITSAISKQGNTIMQKLTQETNLTM